MQWTREMFIPKDARKIEDPDSSAVAYLTEKTNQTGKLIPYMVAFQGKAQKPALNYRYRSDEHRDKHMREFFESVQYRENVRKERAAKRKAAPVGLEVGDVLKSSWGYDQTNVEYYEVISISGRMATLREIAQETEITGMDTGTCVPMVGNYIGEPFKGQARDGTVKIKRTQHYAFKMEPVAVLAGAKIYGASRWSSYA